MNLRIKICDNNNLVEKFKASLGILLIDTWEVDVNIILQYSHFTINFSMGH